MAKKVVIIGAGFAGLSVAKKLKNSDYEVCIIDKRNHHLFQPLLYQVATAGLTPAQIAYPIRQLFAKSHNTISIMDKVTNINRDDKKVFTENGKEFSYDYLIVATGAETNYFGNDWEKYAPSLKSIPDATLIRQNILLAFEKAEIEDDSEKQKTLLTFVLVGGGPTGVEMAGAIAELPKVALAREFKNISSDKVSVYLIEGADKILNAFPKKLSESSKKKLEDLGVNVILNNMVKDIKEDRVILEDQEIKSNNIIWTAGVKASPAKKWLGLGDDSDRIRVDQYCRLKEDKNIFVLGDLAKFHDEKFGGELPGVAPVALQQGKYVGKYLLKKLKDKEMKPFRYLDKGMLATVGRSYAVADTFGFSFKGVFAWFIWAVVHIFYLIGFRNRMFVMLDWAWSYITFQKSSRLIVDEKSK